MKSIFSLLFILIKKIVHLSGSKILTNTDKIKKLNNDRSVYRLCIATLVCSVTIFNISSIYCDVFYY